MAVRRVIVGCSSSTRVSGISPSSLVRGLSTLPPSIKRVGAADYIPNEYPGKVYLFNWALNRDGVTPIKECAFRISKPLDLKVAGLSQPKINPLQVTPVPDADAVMPEAGSDRLSFEDYDDAVQRTKDSLSLSPRLYCPEGFAPGTHTGVRVITNAADLPSDLVAYLDRAPRRHVPEAHPITVYAFELEDGEEDSKAFAGFAIEEIEEMDMEGTPMEPKSVAAVVLSQKRPLNLEAIVTGIQLSVDGLKADEQERAEKKAQEEAEADKN